MIILHSPGFQFIKMNVNIVTCTTWVKKGIAASLPHKVKLSPEDLKNVIKTASSRIDELETASDAEEPQKVSQGETKMDTTDSNVVDEFNFDNYDEEVDDVAVNVVVGEESQQVDMDEAEDSEKEDDIIKDDDNLLLVGRVEEDVSILEIFIYNDKEGSFYCHHDTILSAFPLCIERLNYSPLNSGSKNLCAIGNMTPIIEIWDLDLVDCLEPACLLGRRANKKKKSKGVGHKDAVIDLSWNENFPHILASGSVDQSVLLWDLDNGSPSTKFSNFEEKVQSVEWHSDKTHLLLTGSADESVRLFDCKAQNLLKTWKASGEVEKVAWNKFKSNICYASTNNGFIECIDIRSDKHLWQHKLHEKEVVGLTMSSGCQGLLVSACNDGSVKVWDVENNVKPDLIYQKQTILGNVHCLAANPNNEFVFAVGGDNKAHNLKVFDFLDTPEVKDRFKNRKL